MIIEQPKSTPGRLKLLYGLLTVVFWGLWLYLWMPLITFIAWLLGLDAFITHMVNLEGYRGLKQLLAVYSMVIVILGGSLVIWALYNWMRFHGKERRTERAPVSIAEMSDYACMDPAKLKAAQSSQRLVLHHDDHARVTGIEMA